LKPAGSGALAQSMCTLLSSPGTWFWHSTLDSAVATADATAATAAGPWKARVGNHDALLGGWLYNTDGATGAPADAGDDRTWGVFW
jgi:hypothetical protein